MEGRFMPARVLSVGQCHFDHGNISRVLSSQFSAEVVPAATADEALSALRQGGFALVLVNRVFDSDGGSGLELIREIAGSPGSAPVMLVSNFEDAQARAVAAGAVRGFGKA